jgi:hypothetical protein
MAFVKWEGSLKKDSNKLTPLSSDSPFVSFSGNFGTATFSYAAVDLMNMKSGSLVETYVDKENNKIGFKVINSKNVDVDDSMAEVFTQKPPQGPRLIFKINIRPILEDFGIKKKQNKIQSKLNKVDDMFVADLILPKNDNIETTINVSSE